MSHNIELCGGEHTAQRQRRMQISFGFCTHFMVSVSISVSLSDSVNEPLQRIPYCCKQRVLCIEIININVSKCSVTTITQLQRVSFFCILLLVVSGTQCTYRAFVSIRPAVHKHVKMSVGKWILETTHPHKHVQIPEDDFLTSPHLAWF